MEQSLNAWVYGFAVAGTAYLAARPRLFDPTWRGRIWGSALAGLAVLSLLPLLGAFDVAWNNGGAAGPGMPREGLPVAPGDWRPGLLTLPALPVPAAALLAAWCAVALARVGLLAAAVARIRAARTASRPFPAARLARLPEWTAANAGRFALVLSERVAAPSMLGFGRPMVAVPAAWLHRLSDEMLDAVLLHELCHAERRDELLDLGQQLLLAVCWFHPAAWWVVRRIAFEREAACDQRAARLTTMRRYARCLVTIAETMQVGRLPSRVLVASSAGSRRHIERRLEQLAACQVWPHLARSPRLGLPAVLAVTALVIAVPALPPVFDVGSAEASNLQPPPAASPVFARQPGGTPQPPGPDSSADRGAAGSRARPAPPEVAVPRQLAFVAAAGGPSVAVPGAPAVTALSEPPLASRAWSAQLVPLPAPGSGGLPSLDAASRTAAPARFRAIGSAFARAGAGTGRWFSRAGASIGSAFTPR